MTDVELVQRSEEWLLARAGSLGASKVRDAFTRLKKGERAKIAEDLMYEIAAERLDSPAGEAGQRAVLGRRA